MRRFYGIKLADMYAGRETISHVAKCVWALPPDATLHRVSQPELSEWSLDRQLLAAAVDALNVANWMQSADGEKGRNRPKPIKRPGIGDDETVYGKGEGLPLAEMDDWLGWSLN